MLSPGLGQVSGKLSKHVDALVASGHLERFEDRGPRVRTTEVGRKAIAEHGVGPSAPQIVAGQHAAGEFAPKTPEEHARWKELHAKPSKAKEKPSLKEWAKNSGGGGGSDEFNRDDQGRFAPK